MGNLFYERKRRHRLLYAAMAVVLLLATLTVLSSKKRNNKFNPWARLDRNGKTMGNLPRWDLGDLYSAVDDPSLEKDFLWLERSSQEFARRYSRALRRLSGYELFRALGEYERMVELLAKIESFILLKRAEGDVEEKNRVFFQRTAERVARISSKLVFFRDEIVRMADADMARRLSDSPNLMEHYGRFIEKLRLFKDHQLSDDLEHYMLERGEASVTASMIGEASHWLGLSEIISTRLGRKFRGTVIGGAELANIARGDGRRGRRIRAAKLHSSGLGENIELFTFAINSQARDRILQDRWRKFEKPTSQVNMLSGIGDVALENLQSTIQRNYGPVVQRYYSLKAKMVGRDRLVYSDLFAPGKFSPGKTYGWQEAVALVLAAYEKFSPEVAEICREFLSGSWIDAPPRAGKSEEMLCAPTTPQIHPYLLLNFRGRAEDTLALARGLGCVLGAHLSRGNSYLAFRAPEALSRALSLFGENLVFDHLRESETNIDRKIALVSERIENMIEILALGAIFLEFENVLYEERKQGQLTSERIGEIWLSAWERAFGDTVRFDGSHRYRWAGLQQFFSSPFQSCPSIFASCLANILYSRYRKDPESFRGKYMGFLGAGANANYGDLLLSLGVDLEDENFWQEGLNIVIELIDELEILLKINSLL
ncbi:MAG: M3 family metallopeptidase [Rickettsiales bacterium]|jgi:oligoendopeptidase F|nr:M3 family metallopeptidase [Rickettsiales bacterium]